MSTRNYWLDLFTGSTWQEFLDAGGETTGFRESRWNAVSKIKPGDYFLCYLTGLSRWVGILEVAGKPYKDDTPIWKDEDFPCRLKVKIVAALSPETAVPVKNLKDRLSMFQNLDNPNRWSGPFRGSPGKWKKEDGEAVCKAVLDAKENPVSRPFNKKLLARRPKGFETKIGTVTVPEREDAQEEAPCKSESTPHTEMQWLLLKLGNDMGLDVWAARNDKGREYKGKPFSKIERIKDSLPLQFDEATNRTIEMIDVLWLSGNSILAAFEIESTTSIYSGLLRMSDLIAMQPNINIPLYIVAPDERREKVMNEVNRATFSKLSPPMNEMCRYISFSALRSWIKKYEDAIQYMKTDFLEDLSEPCETE